MGLLSHKVKRSDLEAGDHVYVYRFLGTYSHHGIYVGGDNVVHLSVDNFISSSSCSASCSSLLSPDKHGCGFRKAGSAVTMTCLDCFLGKGSLRRYEYGVGKAAFIAFKGRPGTCTMAQSDAAGKVIHRAMYLLENGFGNYHLLKNNCEVFALYCKTGLLTSYQRRPALAPVGCGQATAAVLVPKGLVNFGSTGVIAIAALELPLIAAVPVAGLFAATVASGINTRARYAYDISQRTGDVHEVEVECLEQFRRSHSARQ